ncbi:bifunctional 2-keto-4-hydroxyglutarate aldolase/2-keto-3-deoxy-6-phosphogluconate aldolase [Secundilactobacillus mixtipabuli]|uniref:2-keto-3-deoxy-6-phosphogluconate aldolase n=1 Tax=Secundilactobacillus mixtipabuli TaxID=1435342 RepID=A0A1Z5IF24_9LACO|nr:bifunctional 2-keto-4-hydroxyglutarate aldolase/2-keto-3-deoxy-6-phosphogluconate aldolase [Secundilactobacillus mixtipabuli]GAX00269.1 2-keto-3-deoxy-6-phosphogluconate aldolase [Secundilactobacillus mixtipabuli]
MKRMMLLNKLQHVGVISVVRAESPEKAEKIAEAVLNGGVMGIELTYTVPHADQVITDLVKKFAKTDAVIGAGTVLDATSARLAIIAGADFIVSPTFDIATAKMCNLYQVPYIPGVFTPTEAQLAMSYGSEVVKLFPGSLATPGAIKELKGPFPYISVMPSGGVTSENLSDWFEAGALVVGAGSNLVGPAQNNDFEGVTRNAQKYMVALRAIMRS